VNGKIRRQRLIEAGVLHLQGLQDVLGDVLIEGFAGNLLDDIAGKLDASAATLPSGQPRRTKLAAIGVSAAVILTRVAD